MKTYHGNSPVIPRWAAIMTALGGLCLGSADARRDLLLVQGAPGDSAYEETFAKIEDGWERTAGNAGDVRVGKVASKDGLREAIAKVRPEEVEELWIVLIGHGTDDGRSSKFNLVGDDVSSEELASWLSGWTKPLILVNNASTSGPFIPALSGEGRVIVTATQSGNEVYAPRFGLFLAQVLGSEESDLDRDGAVSILEASLVAADRVRDYYENNNQIAAEHALVDDNGDGRGTRADWFEGLQLKKKPKGDFKADGNRARQISLARSEADRKLSPEQRVRRDDLERQLEALKAKRKDLEEEAFLKRAEEILLEIGRIYRGDEIPDSSGQES